MEIIMLKPTILYEDSSLIVCVKPAGLPVQTKKLGSMDLEHFLKNHILEQLRREGIPVKSAPYLAVIHRLDQPVSGILVFGKTPEAAKHLSQQLQQGMFTKEYEAVLCGILPNKEGTLIHYLKKDGRTNTSHICSPDTPDSKCAKLSYHVLDTIPEKQLSLVRIHLNTGRHHQIRVQMAGAGAPLWGDNKYNPEFQTKKGYFPIALCARHLEFRHPTTGKLQSYQIDCNWPQYC